MQIANIIFLQINIIKKSIVPRNQSQILVSFNIGDFVQIKEHPNKTNKYNIDTTVIKQAFWKALKAIPINIQN